jgi:sulfur transfer protein SufE
LKDARHREAARDRFDQKQSQTFAGSPDAPLGKGLLAATIASITERTPRSITANPWMFPGIP